MKDDCHLVYVKMALEDIPYVKHIVDTYEGLANSTMMDRELGIMLFRVPYGQMDVFLELLESLKGDEGIRVEEVWE